jgi:hypothetical protein
MSKSIAYYVDTPTIQHAMSQWGRAFERLPAADRFRLIEVLAPAAADLIERGESCPMADTAEAEIIWSVDDETPILEFLAGIDQEFTSPGQCAALIAAIANSLQFSAYPLDQAG